MRSLYNVAEENMSITSSRWLLVALVMLAFPCRAAVGADAVSASFLETAQATRQREVSQRISSEITAGLPRYAATAGPSLSHESVSSEATSTAPGNGTSSAVILLPAYLVNEKPVKIEEKQLYTPETYVRILMKRHLSELDYEFLNRFTLPFFGSASREKRAREAQWRQEWKEMAEEVRLFEQVK